MALPASLIDTAKGPAIRRRPVDLVHLARQCLGDEGLEREVLALYDKTIASYLDRLEAATTREALVMNLHAMRSASAGVGAGTVADLARAAEEALRAGQPVDPERIEDIAMAVAEVRGFIADTVGDLDTADTRDLRI